MKSTVEKLDIIRNRILNGTAMCAEYSERWGDEFVRKQLSHTYSPEKDFGFNQVETVTIDELRQLTSESLYQYGFGFGNWDGNELILLPLWLTKFIEGNPEVISITGNTERLNTCDKDVRFGCIAFGFFKGETK